MAKKKAKKVRNKSVRHKSARLARKKRMLKAKKKK